MPAVSDFLNVFNNSSSIFLFLLPYSHSPFVPQMINLVWSNFFCLDDSQSSIHNFDVSLNGTFSKFQHALLCTATAKLKCEAGFDRKAKQEDCFLGYAKQCVNMTDESWCELQNVVRPLDKSSQFWQYRGSQEKSEMPQLHFLNADHVLTCLFPKKRYSECLLYA